MYMNVFVLILNFGHHYSAVITVLSLTKKRDYITYSKKLSFKNLLQIIITQKTIMKITYSMISINYIKV